jgi:hypothetical protein
MRVTRELFFPDAAGLTLALVPGRRRQGGFLRQIDSHRAIAGLLAGARVHRY